MTQWSVPNIAFSSTPLDMNDQAYLSLVSDILSSGRPYYHFIQVPLPSVFNWDYLQEHIGSYHDGILIDYLKFGFPLGVSSRVQIMSNAMDNHASGKEYMDDIDAFLHKELKEGALFGPFDCKPHAAFTRSPLMTRPKGTGRMVILDLTYGDHSVNNYTDRELYDGSPFKLTLSTLDSLLPTLQQLGINACVLKVDIAYFFCHVPADPGDAIYLGMNRCEKYYVDNFLAFGAVHGTGIFQRITDFVRYILTQQEICVFNYIDDIYTCCHVDVAEKAFHSLGDIMQLLAT